MKHLGVLIAAMTLAAVTTWAQSPDQWNHWRYRASVVVPAVDSGGLVAVPLDPVIENHAASDLSDLRILDDTQKDAPFVIHARDGRIEQTWRHARLLEPGTTTDPALQVVLDGAADAGVHNRARLTFDAAEDYQAQVEVAVSPDARSWTVVRERAPIYDLTRAGMGAHADVAYPDSASRYIRLRISGLPSRTRITSAGIARHIETPVERVPVAVVSFSRADVVTGQSAWIGSAASGPVALSAVRVLTAQSRFHRPISVETSDDGRTWRRVASADIFRLAEGNTTRESVLVPFRRTQASQWRVRIYDRDDAPLTDVTIAPLTTPRRLVFRPDPSRRYVLAYGNARAIAPQYDLVRLTSRDELDAASMATLEPEQINGDHVDPAAWTERHPTLLWAALALAVVVLGFLAMRTLQSGQSSSPS